MTIGDLGLTDREEDLIVTFLQTLTGRFHDTLPQQQGNEFLIPAPYPLPPCAPEICEVEPLPGSES
jgi:hypothetical protein